MDVVHCVLVIPVGCAEWDFCARLPIVAQHTVGRARGTLCRFHGVLCWQVLQYQRIGARGYARVHDIDGEKN